MTPEQVREAKERFERARAITHTLVTRKAPVLHHYTSGDGLLGILSSSELRGGNFMYLNDQAELEYGERLLRDIADRRRKNASTPLQKRFFTALLEYSVLPYWDVYVVCFCTKPDRLSQWRGYGTSASRYCIEFQTSGLERARHDCPVSPPIKVSYRRVQQTKVLESIMDVYFDAVQGLDVDDARAEDLGRSVHVASAHAFTFLKDPKFAEEHEWRSVAAPVLGQYERDLKFVSRDGVIRPLLPVLRGEGERLPIRRVVVGPGAYQRQNEKSARLMLSQFGYEDVPVTFSTVTLSG